MSCLVESSRSCLDPLWRWTAYWYSQIGDDDGPPVFEEESSAEQFLDNLNPFVNELSSLVSNPRSTVIRYVTHDSSQASRDDDSVYSADPDHQEPDEAPLCFACRRLVYRMLDAGRKHQPYDETTEIQYKPVRHLSYNTLSQSHHNCVLCAKIWVRLPHEDNALRTILGRLHDRSSMGWSLASLKDMDMHFDGADEQRYFSLRIADTATSNELPWTHIREPIEFSPFEQQPLWSVRRHRGKESNIGAVHSGHESFRKRLRLVGRWLATCDKEHEQCRRWRDASTGWLPSRLVYVGRTGGLDDPPCIHMSHQVPPGTRYLTLSHCWGAAVFITLKVSNLLDWQTRLPIEELPATFTDAMAVCRDLKVRYIWIDSLCIIQDSRHDWAAEASTMHLVYRYSFLNLAAGASGDVSGGLFRAWNHYLSSNPLLKKLKGIRFWGGGDLSHFHDKEALRIDFQLARLHHRAWVIQELFLSPRTLHFTNLNLWWQCKEHMFSMWNFPNDSLEEIGRGLPCVYTFGHKIQDSEGLLDTWSLLTEDFSASELTYPKDKIVAFEGLSRFFLERLKIFDPSQTLVAGLWSTRICHDLIWFTASRTIVGSLPPGPLVLLFDENRAARNVGEYSSRHARWSRVVPRTSVDPGLEYAQETRDIHVAPSWSWLSVSVPISRSLTQYVGDMGWFGDGDGFQPCAKVLGCNTVMDAEFKHFSRSTSLSMSGPYFWIRVDGRLSFLVTGQESHDGQDAAAGKHAHIQCFFDDAFYHDEGALYCCLATLRHDAMPWLFRGLILQDMSEVENDNSDGGISATGPAANNTCDGTSGIARLERVGTWCSDASMIDRNPEQVKQLMWLQKRVMQTGRITMY